MTTTRLKRSVTRHANHGGYLHDGLWLAYIAIIFLAMDGFYARERFLGIAGTSQGHFTIAEYLRHATFIAEYVLAVVTIYACSQLRRVYALPLLIGIWVLVLVDLSFHTIAGKPAGLTNIAILNGAIGNVHDAVVEFPSAILRSLFWSSLLFVPLLLNTLSGTPRRGRVAYFLAPLALLASIYSVVLLIRGEPALIGFPKGFSYGFGTLSLQVNELFQSPDGSRSFPLRESSADRFNKVIVIIDESILYSQFADLYTDEPKSVDYGKTSSGANCSAASNFILRRAGWIRDGTSDSLDVKGIESLFSIAKRAGYRTIYLDNQNVLNDHAVRNYLDADEIVNIDSVIEGSGETYSRDPGSLETIGKVIGQPKVFILMNKVGAHFAYYQTIPPAVRSANKLANYRKSVEINSKHFLEVLSSIIDSESIVFYTSDHGQDLVGTSPHCNTGSGIRDAEYSVPFVVLTGNDVVREALLKDRPSFENRLSHLEFSESVRNAMGFSVDGIDSIFKKPEHVANRFCGLYGPPKAIFGVNPKCHLLH